MNSEAEFISETLSERPKQVLLCLAKDGAKNKYQLVKSTGISHASMFNLMRFLENVGLVEGKKEGKTRVGLDKISYGLTLFGFCVAIRHADPTDYLGICSRWGSLDYLISKVDSFIVAVGKDETEKLIALFPDAIKEADKALSGCAFRGMVISQLFSKLRGRVGTVLFTSKWVEVLVFDETLKPYLESYVKEAYRCAKEELGWLETVINMLRFCKRISKNDVGKTCKLVN